MAVTRHLRDRLWLSAVKVTGVSIDHADLTSLEYHQHDVPNDLWIDHDGDAGLTPSRHPCVLEAVQSIAAHGGTIVAGLLVNEANREPGIERYRNVASAAAQLCAPVSVPAYE